MFSARPSTHELRAQKLSSRITENASKFRLSPNENFSCYRGAAGPEGKFFGMWPHFLPWRRLGKERPSHIHSKNGAGGKRKNGAHFS